jgi:hypothetical protein
MRPPSDMGRPAGRIPALLEEFQLHATSAVPLVRRQTSYQSQLAWIVTVPRAGEIELEIVEIHRADPFRTVLEAIRTRTCILMGGPPASPFQEQADRHFVVGRPMLNTIGVY